MKKIIVFLSIIIAISATGIPASARTFHLFFVDQKEVFNVGGINYEAWKIGPLYFMEAGDSKPDGYQVRNIVRVLASQGGYDMIYIIANDKSIAEAATLVPEYAGGGTSYGGAWIDFTVRSYEQVGVHSGFTAGAGAKAILRVRWKTGEEWNSGSLSEWIAAGKPLDSMNVNVGIRILGVD